MSRVIAASIENDPMTCPQCDGILHYEEDLVGSQRAVIKGLNIDAGWTILIVEEAHQEIDDIQGGTVNCPHGHWLMFEYDDAEEADLEITHTGWIWATWCEHTPICDIHTTSWEEHSRWWMVPRLANGQPDTRHMKVGTK